LTVNGGNNNIYAYSTVTTDQPGLSVNNAADIATSTNTLYAKLYNSGVTGTIFGYSLANTAFIGSDGSANTGLLFGTLSSDPIVMGTNNAERLRITSGGDVGIGTTSPAYKLDVSGSGRFTNTLYGVGAEFSGTVYTDILQNYTGGTTPLTIKTGGAQSVKIQTNSTDRVILDASGNVGIGTTSPNSLLHVAGSLRLPITTKTATYTLDATDYTVRFDCVTAAANLTANLPDATTCTGRIYTIISNSSATYQLTVDGNGGQTIGGDATIILDPCYNGATLVIQSDGSNWQIISFTAWGGNRC
jgi:hypothetical protein